MAKFCTQCGKPLQEGQVCSCSETAELRSTFAPPPQPNYAPPQPNYAPPSAGTNQFVEFNKGMLALFTDFLKKPVDQIKEAARTENFKAGIFFMLVQAVSIGLFLMACIKSIANEANKSIGFLDGLSNYSVDSNVPYFSIFLKTALFEAGQCLGIALIFFALGKLLFKGSGSFKAVFAVVGVASIPLSVTFLASALAAFVFPKIIFYFLILGLVATLALNTLGVREAMKVEDNGNIYLISLGYVAYFFAIYLFLTIFMKNGGNILTSSSWGSIF